MRKTNIQCYFRQNDYRMCVLDKYILYRSKLNENSKCILLILSTKLRISSKLLLTHFFIKSQTGLAYN